MLQSARIPLGAPGIYRTPDYETPALNVQRMDVSAFVGVAPRGRPHHAVPVRSFDEYRREFGAFEGPGLLPHAVAAYFEQGGRRAYVVRVVPKADPAAWISHARLVDRQLPRDLFATPFDLYASSEGAWGNDLSAEVGFDLRAVLFQPMTTGNAISVDTRALVPPGSLLLLEAGGGRQLVFCTGVRELRDLSAPRSTWELILDPPPVIAAERVHIVLARIAVRDGAGNREILDGLGLHPRHVRYLPRVLAAESILVRPADAAVMDSLFPVSVQIEQLSGVTEPFVHGRDRYGDITAGDFFDDAWSPAEEDSGRGITALARLVDVTHVVVPDLYIPAAWAREIAEDEPQLPPGAEFGDCIQTLPAVEAGNVPPSELVNLIRDPRGAADLAEIARLQGRVVEFCETRDEPLIALVDVPPGLSQGQAERWRARFDSCWCAAYHPWLLPSRRGRAEERSGKPARALAPSAVAAGLIARKELRRGIQFGPANEIAEAVVDLAEPQPEGRADAYHPQGMNCFVRETDGIHLVSARTLSRDPQWRQLSVRRLLLMLRRVLLQQTQWCAFEPNGPKLWRDLRHAIENLLRQLFRAGAFAGGTEADSFFVRVRNERPLLDRGELVVEIGVAPAEPLEFIVLHLRRAGDGTLAMEEG